MTEVKLPRTNERHLKLSESSEREKKKRFKKVKSSGPPTQPTAEASQQQKNVGAPHALKLRNEKGVL